MIGAMAMQIGALSLLVAILALAAYIGFFKDRAAASVPPRSFAANPLPGEHWALIPKHHPSSDPWAPSMSRISVKIVDVKEGWVRYSHGPGTIGVDERRPIKEFVEIFELATPLVYPATKSAQQQLHEARGTVHREIEAAIRQLSPADRAAWLFTGQIAPPVPVGYVDPAASIELAEQAFADDPTSPKKEPRS